MTSTGGRLGVLITSGRSRSMVDGVRRDLEDQGFRVAITSAAIHRSMLRTVDGEVLVVVVIDGSHPQALLRSASLWARRHAAPLVVVESEAGNEAELQRSRMTASFARRLVTRVVPSGTARLLGRDLFVEIGLGAQPESDGLHPLTLEDLPAVGRIHRSAFADSAMSHLGPKVLERYYRWQFTGDHPAPHAWGFRQDGELVGFLVGGVRRDAVSGFARRFLPTIVGGALTNPGGVRRLAGSKVATVLRLMFRRRPSADATSVPSKTTSANDRAVPSFGVLSIAVAPDAQGTGAATALIQAAEDAARARGLGQMHLTVDPANARAVRFYEREGWERDAGEDGQWNGRMRKVLGSSSKTTNPELVRSDSPGG